MVHCATVDNHTMAVLFWPAEHELMFTVVKSAEELMLLNCGVGEDS